MNNDPLTRRNAGLLVLSIFLTIFICAAAIYYRSPKVLAGLIAPLYLVFTWLSAKSDQDTGIIKDHVVTCVSIAPYALTRGIKATFMDAEHNFYSYVIEGGERGMFILGVTYKLWYNEKTGRYVTSVIYNEEEEAGK